MGFPFSKVPVSADVLEKLARFESRNITFQSPDGSWPIVWDRARGNHVWDAERNRYLDLTAAFGVAAAGHAHPDVVLAAQHQLARLPHAMGDVHPCHLKAELCEELSRLTYGRWLGKSRGAVWGKSILCNSGSEAVEAALKTAMLATGRRGVLAFEGAYHGLGYGALNATHRAHFREKFEAQLGGFASFLPFPVADSTREVEQPDRVLEQVSKRIRRGGVGAVLIEPAQARGGIRFPARGFLKELLSICRERGVLLILDEIYTGFGRTGRWFACEAEKVVPDLICLGKALTGGFPLSACVGRSDLMDAAWPAATGEAIHTSTFLGNPVGCAMALAHLGVIEDERLVERSDRVGRVLISKLGGWKRRWKGIDVKIRGRGLMVGAEFRNERGEPDGALVLQVVKDLLREGFVALPEGGFGEVLAWTPSLTIGIPELKSSVTAVERILDKKFKTTAARPVRRKEQ